jgi:hypothetical protein
LIDAPVSHAVGEIVPQCGCTLDVYVSHVRDVVIGDNSARAWQGRLIGISNAGTGVVRMRLALVEGDRLVVRMADLAPHVLLINELAELYTVDTDQHQVLALVQKARALTSHDQIAAQSRVTWEGRTK